MFSYLCIELMLLAIFALGHYGIQYASSPIGEQRLFAHIAMLFSNVAAAMVLITCVGIIGSVVMNWAIWLAIVIQPVFISMWVNFHWLRLKQSSNPKAG
jgi:hypothetical protein